jgi:phosphatidate cytidylyltransferase
LKTFITRALTAIVFVAVLLGCILWDQLSFSILFFLFCLIGVNEFYKLVKLGGNKPNVTLGLIASAVLFLTFSLVHMGIAKTALLYINLPVLSAVFIVELFSKAEKPFLNIACTILGVVYVALPFSLLQPITIVDGVYSPLILIGIFFILWANDTGAYMLGSLLGKHKLFPRISPGKTWEGFVGGVLVAYLVAYLISFYGNTGLRLVDWLVIASILSLIGTLGDLVESLLKRSVDVKDSGSLMPGHGGVLDRFDSLIISTPFLFAYIEYIK